VQTPVMGLGDVRGQIVKRNNVRVGWTTAGDPPETKKVDKRRINEKAFKPKK